MLGYKRSREFNTSKPTEIKIAIKNFGAILYDIPIIIALEKLRSISRSEFFIPKYKKKEYRIALFICESKKKRKIIYQLASELHPSIKYTDFIPQQSSIKNAILSLKSIYNNFNKILKSKKRLTSTLNHQPDYYFNKNTQLVLKILGGNYIDIEKSLSYFLTNQAIAAQDEINANQTIE